jgi:hypothetical protein
MLPPTQVEELIGVVAALDREALIAQFRCYRATFPLDFTDAFLSTITVERLRHIFLAICLQSQRMPELPTAA